MSIFEFAELIIYRHLEPEKELRRGLEENYSKLQSRFRQAFITKKNSNICLAEKIMLSFIFNNLKLRVK